MSLKFCWLCTDNQNSSSPTLYRWAGEVRANLFTFDAKYPGNFRYQKYKKSVDFWRSYYKNKKVEVMMETSVFYLNIHITVWCDVCSISLFLLTCIVRIIGE